MKRAAAALAALICALALCVPALAEVSASTRIYDSSSGYLNNIDLAIANFYKQEGVEKICVFSIPYIHNDISVLVRRRQP